MAVQFQTSKTNFAQTQSVEYADAALKDGEVRCEVNDFSFTANNITYAVVGERIRYWEFFPAIDSDNSAWGVIPVWGFATITESNNSEIKVGERLFGYFPPATTLTMRPDKITELTFFDGAEHRSTLPPGYNVYRRVDNEPHYNADFDQERMLLYPLYVTAFVIHDMLVDNDWYEAEQVVIISASSKTSIGTAYAVAEDESSPTLIGLTSNRNVDFVNSLDLYDSVVDYQDIESIDASKATVIVDMSGNADVIGRLHKHLGDNMRFTSNVGITHWDDAGMGPDFIAERSQQFFAPGRIQQRHKDWGPAEFEKRSTAFLMRATAKSKAWLEINSVQGVDGLDSIYDGVLNGTASPKEGIIVSL
ncbi:MAG: DUF2855 family protein [Pseudomonadota bacterium]